MNEIERTLDFLEASMVTAEQWEEILADDALKENIETRSRVAIAETLVGRLKTVMSAIPEFQYQPLRDRMLENASQLAHVRLDDNLNVVQVFDEELAGTEEDLEAGWERGTSLDDEKRARAWKYGVYVPWRFGDESEETAIADYEGVIARRLRAWGKKAPYWYFIQHGTIPPFAYPESGGKDFIHFTEDKAPSLVAEISQREYDSTTESINLSFVELGRSEKATTMSIEVVDVSEDGIRVEEKITIKGNVFYQKRAPSGRFGKKVTM